MAATRGAATGTVLAMGGRGFPPAPTVVKLAKGERRPSRVNYEEPALPPIEHVKPPKGLTGEGLVEWKRQVPMLSAAGVLTTADLVTFENYCRALTELRRFEAKARRAGPELAIAKGYQGMTVKLRAQVTQLAAECGLSPSSRSRVRAVKKDTPGASPAERYLRALPGGKS